jgi:hypothetical protein
LQEVVGVEDVTSLHLARRWTQKLVSREMADGRARELYSVVSDMGVTSEQQHVRWMRPDRDWQVQSTKMPCGPRGFGTGSSPREGAGNVVGAGSREG